MKTMIFLFFMLVITIFSGESVACNNNEMLKVFFFFFDDETYMPIKIKDIKNKPYNFIMRKDDFFQLLRMSKVAKDSWLENIRMRVRIKNKTYFINKNGVIYFNQLIIGQLDKDILNSIDFGFGLYDSKTCIPLNIQIMKVLKKSNNLRIKQYFDEAGVLADWRAAGFIGYIKK